MLSALGISSKRPDANSLQPRLLTLIKDTRGWPDVCALLLKTVPPETPLKGVKDKKLLEAFLSLIEAQLFPYPSINAATNDLLYATGRILATRPLHAHLPKCPLTFLQTFARTLTHPKDDSTMAPTDAWALLAGITDIFASIVELPAPHTPEDAKLESAGRLHLHTSGLLITAFDVLAAGVHDETRLIQEPDEALRPLIVAASARALQTVHALLVTRPENTEYSVTLAALQLAVAHRFDLLTLCRHKEDVVRLHACELLHACLLEAEPAQYTMLQHAALSSGAVLWMLARCFTGGSLALSFARPQPMHFADGGAMAAGASKEKKKSVVVVATNVKVKVSPAKSDEDNSNEKEEEEEGGGEEGSTSTAEGKWLANAEEAAAVAEAADENGSKDNGDAEGEGEGEGGEVVGGSAASISTTAPPQPPSQLHRLQTIEMDEKDEWTLHRELVALLCDDADEALGLLSRIAPKPFVSRHLYRAQAPAPPAAGEVLAQLNPAERGRVKNLPRQERERYCRAVRHRPEMPRGAWGLYWQDLHSEHYEPEVIWSKQLVTTLQAACAQEYVDYARDCLHAVASGREAWRCPEWEHRTFKVIYPQLSDHLYVAPCYIRPLVLALQEDAASSAPTQLPLKPSVLISRLWQRCVIEEGDEEKALLLDALAAVYAVHGGSEPSLPCMPYLAHLLTSRCDSALLTASVLNVLVNAFRFAQNVRAFLEATGLEPISSLLLRLPMHPPLVNAALESLRESIKASERDDASNALLEGLEALAVAPPRPEACAVGLATIDLLQSCATSSRRVARDLCGWPHLNRISQAILCGDAEVIGRCAELLSMLCDALPVLAPSLHASGAFHFILATLPPEGDDTLSVASAHFLQRFHRMQKIPDGTTTVALSKTTMKERVEAAANESSSSFLQSFLPTQLVLLLDEGSPDDFATAIVSECQQPLLLWGPALRKRLVDHCQNEISHLCAEVLRGRQEWADMKVNSLPDVMFKRPENAKATSYPELERELAVGGVLLRFFARDKGDIELPNPERFADQLITALMSISKGGTPSAAEDGGAMVEMVGGVSDDERRALLLEAQLWLYRRCSGLPHRRLYPRNGWTTLLDALADLHDLVAATKSSSSSTERARACEQATHLLHLLLVEGHSTADGGDGQTPLRIVSRWAEPPRAPSSAPPPTGAGDDGAEDVGGGALEEDDDEDEEEEELVATLSGVPLNVLKCVAAGGCAALLAAIDPLITVIGDSVLAAASKEAPAGNAPATSAAPSAAAGGGGASRLATQKQSTEQANAPMLREVRGALSGQGPEALLGNNLASLASLLCDEMGRDQLLNYTLLGDSGSSTTDSATTSALEKIIRLLHVPFDPRTGRAYRSLAFDALRCLCLAASSQKLRLAMLDAGLPLFLLRLCARRSGAAAAIESARLARLAARLLAMLCGLLPFVFESAAEPAAEEADVSSDVRHLIGSLLPGGLSDQLRAPSGFLRLLHGETRSANLVWVPSMTETLRKHVSTELHALLNLPSASKWAWREWRAPPYPDLDGELLVGGIFLRSYRAGQDIEMRPKRFLNALLASIEEERGAKQSLGRALGRTSASQNLAVKAQALCTLLTIDHTELLLEATPATEASPGNPPTTVQAQVTEVLAWLLCASDPAVLRSSLTVLSALLNAAPAATALVRTALPPLQLSLHLDDKRVAVLVLRALSAALLADSTKEVPEGSKKKGAEATTLCEEALNCGLPLSLLHHLCNSNEEADTTTSNGSNQRGGGGDFDVPDEAGDALRVLSLEVSCLMLLDQRVGGEMEKLLEACFPSVWVDECAQIASAHRAALVDSAAAANGGGADSGAGGNARKTARSLIEQYDNEYATPTLVWNDQLRNELIGAVDDELDPILKRLREAAAGSEKGISSVKLGEYKWKPTALLKRLQEGLSLGQRVNGIFIKPFIATDGFYTFASTDESEGFLTELLEEIRNESLVLMELAKSRGVGLDVPITDEGEESSGNVVVSQALENLTELWQALLLVLTTNVPLQTHKSCLASLSFLFSSLRLPLPFALLNQICQILSILVRAGGDFAPFANAVGGTNALWLLALCRRAPMLATPALTITADLVRRAPRAVPVLLNAGGLLLLLDCIFRNRPPSSGGDEGGTPEKRAESTVKGAAGEWLANEEKKAADAEEDDELSAAAAVPLPEDEEDGSPSPAPASSVSSAPASASSSPSPAEEVRPKWAAVDNAASRAALAERLGAVRVLSVMALDSRHGAEIAERVCALLTPRFRYCFEETPERFLEAFDSYHTSGSEERGNLRVWNGKKRDELAGLVDAEAKKLLLVIAEEDEPVAVEVPSPTARRVRGAPVAGPSEAWLEAAHRMVNAWGMMFI